MSDQTLTQEDTTQFSLHPLPSVAMAKRFHSLATKWKSETGHFSNVVTKCIHPAYQEIIGMGAPVVPFILQDLMQSMDDWFLALSAVTGENPVSEDDAGNVRKMTDAWLRWARARGMSFDV